MLYDLAITPNLAAEFPLDKRWSVLLDYTFPWWVNRENNRAWEILKLDLGTRFWLNRMNPDDPMDILRGHFVGIDLGLGYYDIEPYHTGWQGEFAVAGLEYGYAWRLKNPFWRLEAFAAAGWMGTGYRYYEGNSTDTNLMHRYDGRFTWIGPTKVGFSIKYIFHKTIRKEIPKETE